MVIALSSTSSITRFATTTETGDPMAVPWTCWYIFPLNCRKVALRHRVRRSTVSQTLKSVLSGRVGSFSSLRRATCTTRSVGTQVNKDTTSKDTIASSSVRVCLEMNSAKSLELRTCEVVCPTTGVSRSARNLTACTSEKTQSTQWGEGGHPVCVPLASHTVEVFAPLSFSGVYTPYQGVDRTASGSSMCCSFSSPGLVLGPFPVGDTCSHPSAVGTCVGTDAKFRPLESTET